MNAASYFGHEATCNLVLLSPSVIADQPASTALLFARLKQTEGYVLVVQYGRICRGIAVRRIGFVGTVQPLPAGLSAVKPWYLDFWAVRGG